MSDMSEQAKTYMQDLRGCVAGEDPYFPTADELPIIDHAIAALSRPAITPERLRELEDAELIAWAMTNRQEGKYPCITVQRNPHPSGCRFRVLESASSTSISAGHLDKERGLNNEARAILEAAKEAKP